MILLELFWVFFKIGAVSFGGGYAIISALQYEVVSRGWLTAMQYAQIVTISQITPGPIAVNAATYVGAKIFEGNVFMSLIGSLVATFSVSLPSFILVILAAKIIKKFINSKEYAWIMAGIRPVIIAFIASAVLVFAKLAYLNNNIAPTLSEGIKGLILCLNPIGILIGLVVFYLSYKKKMSPIILILISAVVGIILL